MVPVGWPARTTARTMHSEYRAGYRCHRLRTLSLDGCVGVDTAAITALTDVAAARALLTAEPGQTCRITGLVHGGMGCNLSPPPPLLPEAGPTPLCRSLTSLNLSGCTAVGDRALLALRDGGVRPRELRLNGCPALTDEGVCALIGPALEHLELASRRRVGACEHMILSYGCGWR
jgi:hypothetical protein